MMYHFLYLKKSVYLNHIIDPAQEFSHLGVHSRMIGLSTACPPADNPYQPPHIFILAHQRTPAVPLER